MLLASRILQQHLTNVTAPGGNPGTLFQQRQLVFLALAGEPWGYMGSRRLLWELSQGSPTVAGLNWQLVDQVRAGRGEGWGAVAAGDPPVLVYWLVLSNMGNFQPG
jgi:hypothetical protein